MEPVIEVVSVTRQFRQLTAVDQVSFAVPEGACFGLLGPNGAGKTTTIEIMEGIQRPTKGHVLYFGRAMQARQLYQDIGIQFQHTALQDHLTVRDTLRLFAAFYQRCMPLEDLLSLCALHEFADRDTRALSGGQRQRLLLALALVNDPRIVFLDEPTSGLDPQARQHFWALIESIRARGKTIIMTTHYMEEAQQLCDDIAIMDRGRIIARGAPDALLAEHFSGAIVRLDDVSVSESLLARYGGERQDSRLQFHTTEVEALIAELIRQGVPLRHLEVQAPNLNDLFLQLTGYALRA